MVLMFKVGRLLWCLLKSDSWMVRSAGTTTDPIRSVRRLLRRWPLFGIAGRPGDPSPLGTSSDRLGVWGGSYHLLPSHIRKEWRVMTVTV